MVAVKLQHRRFFPTGKTQLEIMAEERVAFDSSEDLGLAGNGRSGYISMRDLLKLSPPSTPVSQPAAEFKNPLLTHAACAYLQPTGVFPQSGACSQSFFRRVGTKIFGIFRGRLARKFAQFWNDFVFLKIQEAIQQILRVFDVNFDRRRSGAYELMS